ncbi:hypothetical protein GCM10010278_77000 [Streptomyces melanogenes]|nr:hypothetical protein GCM10010278_77000 [Streptomyces melanogenes]
MCSDPGRGKGGWGLESGAREGPGRGEAGSAYAWTEASDGADAVEARPPRAADAGNAVGPDGVTAHAAAPATPLAAPAGPPRRRNTNDLVRRRIRPRVGTRGPSCPDRGTPL